MARSMASGFWVRPAPFAFRLDEFDCQGCWPIARPLRPGGEQIYDIFIEAIRPDMSARFRVNELGVHAHPVGVALHGAFEDVAHAKLLADFLGVEVLALEGEGGVAGD